MPDAQRPQGCIAMELAGAGAARRRNHREARCCPAPPLQHPAALLQRCGPQVPSAVCTSADTTPGPHTPSSALASSFSLSMLSRTGGATECRTLTQTSSHAQEQPPPDASGLTGMPCGVCGAPGGAVLAEVRKAPEEIAGLIWEDHTRLAGVVPGSAAERGGLGRLVGMRATEANGHAVQRLRDLRAQCQGRGRVLLLFAPASVGRGALAPAAGAGCSPTLSPACNSSPEHHSLFPECSRCSKHAERGCPAPRPAPRSAELPAPHPCPYNAEPPVPRHVAGPTPLSR
eukprot:TRINITY_DN3904_c3_g1_i2.p1 TRINITY_DN3904_c3_g1~~TRINITY_DN3904_c3_g1_i2.p1  ORF type:complete len:287 (+),score=24.54 TRINITY_DN3904_c3_g1_i2:59-919(+)